MNSTGMRFAIFTAGIVLGCNAGSAQDIHLKARDIYTGLTSSTPPRADTRAKRVRPSGVGPVHEIVQFDHPPSAEDMESLKSAGFKVIAAVPDNAVTVLAPNRIRVQIPKVQWVGELGVDDKLSPDLVMAGKIVGQSEGTPTLTVIEFHADVSAAVQQSIAALEGVTLLRPPVLLPNHAIANVTFDQLLALAAHDEVAYVFPADPELLSSNASGNELMPCAGMLTLAGPIAQYANIVHGWDLDSDNTAHLGYIFGAPTTKLPASEVQAAVIRAFQTWASITNVEFTPAMSLTAARTVMVEFASGAHGDAYPFDSAGQILAHTFYPVPLNPESLAGDMHLNAAVNWHDGSDIDVYTVALHEAGHAIGLGHTDNPGDVMYPYYKRGMQLSANDIGAAQALYGVPGPPAASDTTGPPALSLTLNPIASPGQAAQTAISGTVSGGTPPVIVDWQTNQGFSGKAVAGTGVAWSAGTIPLVTGANTLTVTAFDSAQKTASESAVVTRLAAAPVTTTPVSTAPLSIHISSPSSAVVTASSSTISIGGTAAGGNGITKVTWQTSGGSTGTATGAAAWVAPSVPLLVGTNTIIVYAFAASGASAWASVIVDRN